MADLKLASTFLQPCTSVLVTSHIQAYCCNIATIPHHIDIHTPECLLYITPQILQHEIPHHGSSILCRRQLQDVCLSRRSSRTIPLTRHRNGSVETIKSIIKHINEAKVDSNTGSFVIVIIMKIPSDCSLILAQRSSSHPLLYTSSWPASTSAKASRSPPRTFSTSPMALSRARSPSRSSRTPTSPGRSSATPSAASSYRSPTASSQTRPRHRSTVVWA